MSRIDVKQLNCPVSSICCAVGDHSHFACDECGAVDYSGRCLTCITMRGITFARIVRTFAEPA